MKKIYEKPMILLTSVEVENGFMNGSVVDKNEEDSDSITIENQEVGAESDYFSNGGSGWDY